MPHPDALATAIEAKRTRRQVEAWLLSYENRTTERRPLPYGGDKAVAASIANHHRPQPWTGRCAGCREPWPCRDARDTRRVLNQPHHTPRAPVDGDPPLDTGTVGLLVAIGLLLTSATVLLALRVVLA